MTHDERQALISQPFPPLRRIVYRGAIWAGILVPKQDDYDELMRDLKHRLTQRGEHGLFEYQGLYKDSGAITQYEYDEVFSADGV